MADDWRQDALCAGRDPELWFPPCGDHGNDAKRICRRCPVIADCLQYALAVRDDWGIWGGLSHRQRRLLHRRTETAA